MSKSEAGEFLAERTEGRLATCDAAGHPYITPLNYLYHAGKIYFHCKTEGRKLDNIAVQSRVCFEVSQTEKAVFSGDPPCKCATRYRSVLAFGTARVVTDAAEKAALLNLLMAKFASGKPFQPVDEQRAAECAVVEITVEEISGKRNVDPE